MNSPGGEVFLGIRRGGVPPGSPNPGPISGPKSCFFHTRFQTWPLKSIPVLIPGVGRNYVIIIEIRAPAKRILKIYLDFAYYSFFLIHQFGIETTNTFMHFLENYT